MTNFQEEIKKMIEFQMKEKNISLEDAKYNLEKWSGITEKMIDGEKNKKEQKISNLHSRLASVKKTKNSK